MNLIQFWIVFTGGVSTWLMATGRYLRLGCAIGLLGQPFWFYETAKNFQWGMFVLSIVFTLSYIHGFVRGGK